MHATHAYRPKGGGPTLGPRKQASLACGPKVNGRTDSINRTFSTNRTIRTNRTVST